MQRGKASGRGRGRGRGGRGRKMYQRYEDDEDFRPSNLRPTNRMIPKKYIRQMSKIFIIIFLF